MKMKSIILNIMQQASHRLVACALVFGCCVAPAFAQSEDEEEMEETTIKQPTRKAKADNYPTIVIKGIVTDQATKKPLPGVQLQALGYIRYTAMTGEDGKFEIKVPAFATALYVHSPQYSAQQVPIVAGFDECWSLFCQYPISHILPFGSAIFSSSVMMEGG